VTDNCSVEGNDVAELGEELRRAVGQFVRATRARADQLSRTHADALGALDRNGPQTIVQLAQQHGIRHQGMSRTVAELDAAGLVIRTPTPADARGWIIAISEQGVQSLRADRVERRNRLAEQISKQLTDSDRETLRTVPALLLKLSQSE